MNAAKTMTILTDAGVTTRSLGIRRLDPTAVPAGILIRDGRYDVVHAHLEMAITLAKPACTLTRTRWYAPSITSPHHWKGVRHSANACRGLGHRGRPGPVRPGGRGNRSASCTDRAGCLPTGWCCTTGST